MSSSSDALSFHESTIGSTLATFANKGAQRYAVQAMMSDVREYFLHEAFPNIEHMAMNRLNTINGTGTADVTNNDNMNNYDALQVRYNNCVKSYKDAEQLRKERNIVPNKRSLWTEGETLILFEFVQTLINAKTYFETNSFNGWVAHYRAKCKKGRKIEWQNAKRRWDRLLDNL